MKFKRLDKRSDAEKKFDAILEAKLEGDVSTEDLGKISEVLVNRNQIRKDHRISPDTKAIIAGNLLGIVLILTNERAHVITTKALGFIIRGRV